MVTAASRQPVSPGDPAPEFVLPAVNHDGTVALADYRGKTSVLIAMMRGLYCAFCRRHIAQLGTTRQKLLPLGVDVLAIIAMPAERARLYYRFRPVNVPLAADPELVTHHAYGVPQPALTPEITQEVTAKYTELARQLELPETDPTGIRSALCKLDGFEPVPSEQKARRDWSEQDGAQLIGQFLVDRAGIIRWVNVEGATEGLAGLEKFPSDEEFLAAAKQLTG
jgi:peroxiredoxin